MNKKLLEYFNGDELAASVWLNKYAAEGEETPDDMHKRLAKEFARIEEDYTFTTEDLSSEAYNNLSMFGKELYDIRINQTKEEIEESIYNLFKDFKYIVPQGSIMSQLGVKSIGSLSNCFQGDVKVLTRTGWIPIKFLAGNDVEIMTKGGKWVTAPFKSYGNQHLDKITLSNGQQEKIIYATSKHRWALYKKTKPEIIHKIKTTSELEENDILYATYGRGRGSFKLFSVGITHGITYGDGHSVIGENNSNNITLCSDSRSLGKYFPESYVSSDESNCEGGSDFYSGLPNYFRRLPDINENKSYLYSWLAGYFAADGHIDKQGAVMLNSSKKIDIEIVKDICGVLGIGCTDMTQQTVISNLTNKEHTMYKCFIHKNHLSEDFFLLDKHKSRYKNTGKEPSRWKVKSVQTTTRVEEVFCAEVPETESFVIEGNILSMNCFVIGQPEDSYGGIFEKDEQLAQLMKRRGGVGLDISTLRPESTVVSNAAKTTTGAISFMHRFSNTTREVAQNGRRGALMLSISINHPDVMEFIKIKRDLSQVTGANISIKLNNEFMKAVENDEDYILRFPCNITNKEIFEDNLVELEDLKYNKLYDHVGEDAKYIKKIKAKEYWDEIIKSAHNVAEPGLMFEDNHINYSPDGVYYQYRGITSNPCGEIFMQAFDACRLIAVNLFSFVNNPFTKNATFDFKKFYEINYEAMRLSDDLIDLELEHIDRIIAKIKNDPESKEVKSKELELWNKIKETAAASRRTGLGITGLGDCLAALGLKYDSDKGISMINEIFRNKMESELECTIDLAELRGSFEGWDRDNEFLCEGYKRTGENSFFQMLADEYPSQVERMLKSGRRNVSWSTVAPTGTVSLMTQTSSGMEPLFKAYYTRKVKVNPGEDVRVDSVDQNGDSWTHHHVLHPKFKEWFKVYNGDQKYLWENFDEKALQEAFENSPWYGSEADDIDWIKRVEVQSTIQKYISHSISSTINLPTDVSEKEVSDIYLESWKQGLKGVTVYREGSRTGVLVSENSNVSTSKFDYVDAIKRPKCLPCDVHSTVSKGTKWNVIVGLLDDKPYEVFTIPYFTNETNLELCKMKKGRYDLQKNGETYSENITSEMTSEEALVTRLISTSLRHRTDIQFIVEQLNKAEGDITSFGKAVSRVLKKYIPEGTSSTVSCQECGSDEVIFQEGCLSCQECGSSKCG